MPSGSGYKLNCLLNKLKLSSFLISKAIEQFPSKTYKPWFCSIEKKKKSVHKHECNSSLGLETVSECQIFYSVTCQAFILL